jgi:hypothetical protein
VNLLKENSIVTTTKEVQVPPTDKNLADTTESKGKKSKKRKGRSKDKEKLKSEVPDRQCAVM